jgi:hypothetical protein
LERPEVRQSSRRVIGVILLSEDLPQEVDFEDQDDLWRGQRPSKAEGELKGVILLTVALPQEPAFEDQGDLWRGQRSGTAETE